MTPPRFLLVLAANENLLRAALVMRDLRIASAAKQTFQLNDGVFDPAEVWYKMKKVIAACFDIGRTQPRELLACALVSDDDAWMVWQDRAGDVDSIGSFANAMDTKTRFAVDDAPRHAGTLRTWLLWNLTGAYVVSENELAAWRRRALSSDVILNEPHVCKTLDETCLGTIRARSPFAEPLAVAGVFSAKEFSETAGEGAASDAVIQRVAAHVFAKMP